MIIYERPLAQLALLECVIVLSVMVLCICPSFRGAVNGTVNEWVMVN